MKLRLVTFIGYPKSINQRISKKKFIVPTKQIKGTAMGTKVAPTYATLNLGFLEHKLHSKICTFWGKEITTNIKANWKRFLDDCFILWDNDDDKLSDFLCLSNQLNSDIQFTIETDERQMPFLDVLVLKDNTSLNTNVSRNKRKFFGSSHPHHAKTAIPYNLTYILIQP